MPRQISISTITDAVLDSLIDAQQVYEIMSGGRWLWQAPEYFITSTIARNISNLAGSKFVTLEHGSTNTIEDAGAKGRGRLPKNFRAKGKVDILLWWANKTPRAIIEVKNQIYSNEQYVKDIERIGVFLKRNSAKSSIQFGIFTFYESAFTGSRKTAKEKIDERIEKIHVNSKRILGSNYKVSKLTTPMNEEVTNNAWQAVCFVIQLKKTKQSNYEVACSPLLPL